MYWLDFALDLLLGDIAFVLAFVLVNVDLQQVERITDLLVRVEADVLWLGVRVTKLQTGLTGGGALADQKLTLS